MTTEHDIAPFVLGKYGKVFLGDVFDHQFLQLNQEYDDFIGPFCLAFVF